MAKKRVRSSNLHEQDAEREGGRRKPARQPVQQPRAEILDLQQAAGNRAVERSIQKNRPVRDDPAPYSADPQEVLGALGKGKPLAQDQRQQLGDQMGQDLSGVEIHDDPIADYAAKALGAEAFAVGKHIVFRRGSFRPGSPAGQALLAHEAQHIAAGAATGGTGGAQPVQLLVSVDDVTEEMVGQSFTLRSDQGSGTNAIPKGATVTITDWKGTSRTATVEYRTPGGAITLDVPKLALQPVDAPTAGVRAYRIGLGGQQKAVERAEKRLREQKSNVTKWQAQEKFYKKNRKSWEAENEERVTELTRQEGEFPKMEKELSRMLVRQTMYNRFDPLIKQWVDHYNGMFHPDKPLDPNIVKSMIFRESRMGTSGEHLEMPPYSWAGDRVHPIRSRFNIGQAIDSRAEQQLLMVKEMAPAIFSKYGLDKLEKANKQKGMTLAEFAAWEGGKFVLAIHEMFTARDSGGKNMMGTPGRDLHLDYGFWIRTAVRWLFKKYMSLPEKERTWEEAVRAFNGGGQDAQDYKKDVMRRVGSMDDLNVGNK